MDARSTSDPIPCGDPFAELLSGDVSALADVQRIRDLLVEAAQTGEAVSYSAVLHQLGLRFSRPKMRALCRTMEAIDAAGRVAGEPGLAVLVVRESDSLPGQGWWLTHAAAEGHAGEWTGPAARVLVERVQARAFRYWCDRDD